MKALTYNIHLLEPLLATKLDGDPNSAISHNYIPGSLIRGALIGMYLRREHLSELDVANEDIRRVFFSDNIQYLNVYPVVGTERTLPLSKSWHVPKGQTTPIADLALADTPPKEPKQVGSAFGVMNGAALLKVSPENYIAVHTQRDRKKGRATDSSGAVYRYESLAHNQTFAGAILCETDSDANWLQTLLTDGLETEMGGARSAGYGRVRFEHVRLSPDWTEAASRFEPSRPLVVTLLSDAILRNDQGEYEPTAAALRLTIARRLGISPEHVGKSGRYLRAFTGTTVVGGFNRKWGLPLPQTPALVMGSTVVFENHALTNAQVTYLMRWGIGERRTEGFGRVGINLYSEQEFKASNVEARTDAQPSGGGPQIYSVLPQPIARRTLQRQIDLLVVQFANEIAKAISHPPRSSQISALRMEVQRTLRTDPMDRTILDNTLNHIEERTGSRRQFEKARVGNTSLIEWTRSQIDDTSKWNEAKKDTKRAIANLLQHSGLSEAFACRTFNLGLIDAVLARAAKSSQRESKP